MFFCTQINCSPFLIHIPEFDISQSIDHNQNVSYIAHWFVLMIYYALLQEELGVFFIEILPVILLSMLSYPNFEEIFEDILYKNHDFNSKKLIDSMEKQNKQYFANFLESKLNNLIKTLVLKQKNKMKLNVSGTDLDLEKAFNTDSISQIIHKKYRISVEKSKLNFIQIDKKSNTKELSNKTMEIKYKNFTKTIKPIHFINQNLKINCKIDSIVCLARNIILITLVEMISRKNCCSSVNKPVFIDLINSVKIKDLKQIQKKIVFKIDSIGSELLSLPYHTFELLFGHGFNKIKQNEVSKKVLIFNKMQKIKIIEFIDIKQSLNSDKNSLTSQLLGRIKIPTTSMIALNEFCLEINNILKYVIKNTEIKFEKFDKNNFPLDALDALYNQITEEMIYMINYAFFFDI